MKKVIFLLVLYCFNNTIQGQNFYNKQDLIKDKAVYLEFKTDKVKFFITGNSAGSEPLQKSHILALRGTYCNVHFRWLNPLKYGIVWKDSIYTDPDDEKVKDFIALFVGQFTKAVPDLNDAALKSALKAIPSRYAKPAKPSKSGVVAAPVLRLYGVEEKDNFDGYHSLELMNLYMELRNNEDKLTSGEIGQLNSLLEELDLLDQMNSTDISKEVDEEFLELFKIDDFTKVEENISDSEQKIEQWEGFFTGTETSQTTVMGLVNSLSIKSNPIFELYAKKVISNFSSGVSSTLKGNRIIVSKFEPCKDILKKSMEGAVESQKGFYENRIIKFDDGKVLETVLAINKYEYDLKSKEILKKTEVYSSKIIFRRYRQVTPVISTGVFYSDANLKGYGVATDDNGDLIVTEDDIKKNSAVTALFLNLNFEVDPRYFSPLIQLGIDPTKKRPYMLAGGGFSIPVAKMALTGGVIWTWDPTLEKLEEGQVIESTTDLENDIKYKFDFGIKGWYLGLQYNFN